VQVALGRWEQAAQGYEDALGVLTGAVVVQQALLDVEVHLGRHDRALARINAIMAPLPVKAPWLMRRADVEEVAGRHRGARADRMIALRELDQLVSRRGSPNQLLLRARCRWQLGDTAGAKQDLSTVLDIQPGAPGAAELKNLITTNRRPHP
jgi:tetratricopeptide (TPR) repeat protein